MLYCALVWLLSAHVPPNIRWFIRELPSWLGTAHSTTVPAGVSICKCIYLKSTQVNALATILYATILFCFCLYY